jgi:predicted homoserine dehydrogenase-like protein
MLKDLRAREDAGAPLRIALLGAGSMGTGIAWQLGRTPGMRLVAVADRDLAAAERAAEAYGRPASVLVTAAPSWLEESAPAFDVLVEATNTIGFAAEACLAAIARGSHVVLMNAEVDLALAPLLAQAAARRGVVVTSDAGDQHGVLARMVDEILMWGFEITMVGNIKGFLDRHATAQGLEHEARIRRLNPAQCCAYTDGTKLNVEMALLANGLGLPPSRRGMRGPRLARVEEVLRHFDFDEYRGRGVVDYILGAEPGGGVFVVGSCDDPLQQEYLRYYKLGDGPHYLFFRPYHLCHLETTRAIALAALYGKPVLQATRRIADVYAFAKRDIAPGEALEQGIGSDLAYGLIERVGTAAPEGLLPISSLEAQGALRPRFRRALGRDQPIRIDDVELPESSLQRRLREQQELLRIRADA